MATSAPNIFEMPDGNQPGWKNDRNYFTPFNPSLGLSPFFSDEVMRRVHLRMPVNIVFCGQPGNSKSYSAMQFCKHTDKEFNESQICYKYDEVIELQLKLPEFRPILMDEPEFIAGNRTWHVDMQRALISTLRSARFLCHPLVVPTLNRALLDLVVRRYLINFMVWFNVRGRGVAYELLPSRFSEEVRFNRLGTVFFEMLDVSTCPADWCMTCPKFKDDSCKTLRSQYEHLRQRIQLERYASELKEMRERGSEQKKQTKNELHDMAMKVKDKLVRSSRGYIVWQSLQNVLRSEFQVEITDYTCINLAKRLDVELGYRK
jgi:hypothetical protein